MYHSTLSPQERFLLRSLIANLEENGRLAQTRTATQHGSTTVFAHCVKVACFSLFLANKLHLTVDVRALLRGALLHDYFLYDWHEKNAGHRFHGFTHPGTALKNAQEDFRLTPVEQNIIARHMFPLCPIPPSLPRSVAGVRGRQILRSVGDGGAAAETLPLPCTLLTFPQNPCLPARVFFWFRYKQRQVGR